MQLQLTRRLFLSIMVLAAPAVASAQEADTRTAVLARGTRSIQVPFPTSPGSSAFGIWSMRSDRTALGLTANVGIQRNAETNDNDFESRLNQTFIAAGPAWKRYHQLHPTLAAFGTVGVQGIFSHATLSAADDERTQTSWGGGATAGVGAEWFPFSRVSLGGTTGISGDVMITDRDDQIASSGTSFQLRTFTSEMTVQFYF